MLLGGDVRVCIAHSETDNEVENIARDALETTQSVALGPVICSSRVVAGGSDEVGKTVDSHCGRQ